MMLITLNDVSIKWLRKLINYGRVPPINLLIAKLYGSDKKLINNEQEPNVRLIRDYVSRGIISKPKKSEKKWCLVTHSL